MYRGTSLIVKRLPVGPHIRTMPRARRCSWGEVFFFLYEQGTPVALSHASRSGADDPRTAYWKHPLKELPSQKSPSSKVIPKSQPVSRCRARTGQMRRFEGVEPGSRGKNLALTVSHVPHSLDSGPAYGSRGTRSERAVNQPAS